MTLSMYEVGAAPCPVREGPNEQATAMVDRGLCFSLRGDAYIIPPMSPMPPPWLWAAVFSSFSSRITHSDEPGWPGLYQCDCQSCPGITRFMN